MDSHVIHWRTIWMIPHPGFRYLLLLLTMDDHVHMECDAVQALCHVLSVKEDKLTVEDPLRLCHWTHVTLLLVDRLVVPFQSATCNTASLKESDVVCPTLDRTKASTLGIAALTPWQASPLSSCSAVALPGLFLILASLLWHIVVVNTTDHHRTFIDCCPDAVYHSHFEAKMHSERRSKGESRPVFHCFAFPFCCLCLTLLLKLALLLLTNTSVYTLAVTWHVDVGL